MLRKFVNCYGKDGIDFTFKIRDEYISITAIACENHAFVTDEVRERIYKIPLDFHSKDDYKEYKKLIADLCDVYTGYYYDRSNFYMQWEAVFLFAKTGEDWHKWA